MTWVYLTVAVTYGLGALLAFALTLVIASMEVSLGGLRDSRCFFRFLALGIVLSLLWLPFLLFSGSCAALYELRHRQ